MTAEKQDLLGLADSGLKHADMLSAALEKPGWRPSRAHVEQARNKIRQLEQALRTIATPVSPCGVKVKPLEWCSYIPRAWSAESVIATYRIYENDGGAEWFLAGGTERLQVDSVGKTGWASAARRAAATISSSPPSAAVREALEPGPCPKCGCDSYVADEPYWERSDYWRAIACITCDKCDHKWDVTLTLSGLGDSSTSSDGLCHCSWGCVEASNCRRMSAHAAEDATRIALGLAVDIIMANEPGHSCAVSDVAVALAAVSSGDISDNVMKVINDARAEISDAILSTGARR